MSDRTKRPYRRAEETRRHVLDVAARIFGADGIRSVGVDWLAAQAGVTTTTLYRLFGSKDELVAAYLRRSDEVWFEWLERAVAGGGLPRFFDELDRQARAAGYRGCPFRMALAEHPAADSAIHRVAIENKRRTFERFRELAAAAGADHPEIAAGRLMLIMDGICASAAERGPRSPKGAGPQLVRELLA
jgi:AcrR family transcriptional regulator